MKRHRIVGIVLAVATLALLVYSKQLQGRAVTLRSGVGKLAAARRPIVETAASIESNAAPADAPIPQPLTDKEKAELLRLRGQVQPLLRRQAELAVHSNRHAQLRSQIEAARKAGGPPPSGYIRRADARQAGNTTPESAFETFLWAIEHRDTNVFLNSLTGHSREMMGRLVSALPKGAFFEKLPIPGGRIVVRKELAPDALELSVDFGAGTTFPMKVQREGTSWFLELE
jgi:hypothetical protein